MARRAAATSARPAPARRAPVRRPGPPRRVSGPVPSGAVALPGRVMRAPFARAAKARAGGVLDALLQGRAWIALVALLLVGIVFFNVDLLELNRNIARTADKAAKMKRENAGLRLQVARLASSERIQNAAARRGLELPQPGDVRYLSLRPRSDARRAAANITEPGTETATPVTSGTPATAPAAPTVQAQPQAPTQEQGQTQTPQTQTQTQTQTPQTQTTPQQQTPQQQTTTAPPAAGSPTGGAAPAPTNGTGG